MWRILLNLQCSISLAKFDQAATETLLDCEVGSDGREQVIASDLVFIEQIDLNCAVTSPTSANQYSCGFCLWVSQQAELIFSATDNALEALMRALHLGSLQHWFGHIVRLIRSINSDVQRELRYCTRWGEIFNSLPWVTLLVSCISERITEILNVVWKLSGSMYREHFWEERIGTAEAAPAKV